MNQDIVELNVRDETDEFDLMSDRDLLLSMARDARAVKELFAGAVETVAPLMRDPKIKLAMKLFG